MSFRSSEGSQHRDAGAAATKQAAKLILNGEGGYEILTEGTADAILIANAGGGYEIAASGTPAARFIQIGDTIYLLAIP